jgi:hypothetical protein
LPFAKKKRSRFATNIGQKRKNINTYLESDEINSRVLLLLQAQAQTHRSFLLRVSKPRGVEETSLLAGLEMARGGEGQGKTRREKTGQLKGRRPELFKYSFGNCQGSS